MIGSFVRLVGTAVVGILALRTAEALLDFATRRGAEALAASRTAAPQGTASAATGGPRSV